jgi:hypothetical protein
MQRFKVCMVAALILGASGCSTPPAIHSPSTIPQQLPLTFNARDKIHWETVVFPGKLRTEFRRVPHEGRDSIQAESVQSASMLRQRVHIPTEQLGLIHFEWQVDTLLENANLTEPSQGDSPVRLVLAFDGDRQHFSARDAMLSELSRALTGEDMPYATLMYVWSNHLPVDTVIVHPRTSRVRKIVVESGPARLRQWLHYERDLQADFKRAFGEAAGPLQAIGIMTDSDNTRSRTKAWYGTIGLKPAQ